MRSRWWSVIGAVAALLYHDVICPLAIAAFTMSLPLVNRFLAPELTTIAVGAGIVLIPFAAYAAFALARDPREPHSHLRRYPPRVPADPAVESADPRTGPA